MILLPFSAAPFWLGLVMMLLIVMAEPPAERVVPSIEKAVGLGVKTWPATVYALVGGLSDGLEREMVSLPIDRIPDWPRLTKIPSTAPLSLAGERATFGPCEADNTADDFTTSDSDFPNAL